MPTLSGSARGLYAAAAPARLFQLIFFVTARCNARCKMCFYLDQIEQANNNLTNELTLKEIENLAGNLGHVPYLSLSGGEPFLRRDLFELVDAMVSATKPLMVSIPTNGAYPERVEAVISRLAKLHSETQFDIQLSLDGPEHIHDEIRQVPGLYKRLFDTHHRLRALQKELANLGIKVVTTYSTFNQDHVSQLLDQIEQDFPADRVILAKAHGNCSPETKDGLNLNVFRRLLKRVETINSKTADQRTLISNMSLRIKRGKEKIRQRFEQNADLGKFCGAGRKLVVLGETGVVFPCEILDRPLGNIRNYDFDLYNVLNATMPELEKQNTIRECHCDWGCAQNIAVVSSPRFWPSLFIG